jgi:hypothetical protein
MGLLGGALHGKIAGSVSTYKWDLATETVSPLFSSPE